MPPLPPPTPRPLARLLTAVALLVAIAASLPARADQHVSLQLPAGHHVDTAGFLLAIDRGYYREAGLTVELRPGGPGALAPLDAVLGGHAQFGLGGSGLALARREHQPVVAVAALLQQSTQAWLLPASADSADLAALARRPALLPGGTAQSIDLLLPFALQGLALRTLPSPMAGADLSLDLQGEAELLPVDQPRDLPLVARERRRYTLVDPRELGIASYGGVVFTTEAFAREHADIVRRFRDASLRGWADALSDVEGTARWLHTRLLPQVPESDLQAAGRRLREAAGYGANELGHMSRQRWLTIAAQQHDAGFGRDPLDVDDFVFDARLGSQPAWPDPVRVATVGLVAVMLLALMRMVRANAEMARAVEALKAIERERQADELRFQFLMDVAPFPVAIYDWRDGSVRYANERAGACLRETSLVGQPIQRWLAPLAPQQLDAAGLRAGRLIEELEVELPASPDQAAPRWCQLSVRAIEFGGVACGFVTFADISARKQVEQEARLLSEQRALILQDVEQLQARLREASVRDPLTGLFNRRHFDAVAERERASCRRQGHGLGLLVLDADHFKRVNDGFGHAGGDAVLRRLGQLLGGGVRAGDIACRFGGEEFAVLLPGIDAGALLERAQTLRAAVEATQVEHDGQVIRVTVSVGVARLDPDSDEGFDALFRRADAAAYAAKQGGRNRVVVAAPASPEPRDG